MNALPVLAARITSLAIAVLAVHRFGSTVPYMQGIPAAGYWLAIGSMLVFPLILAAVLWFAPSSLLGRKLDLVVTDAAAITSSVLARIMVSLLAMWILAFGLVDLVYFETEIWTSKRAFPESYQITPEQLAGRVTNIVQILIGIGLWKQRYQFARLMLGKHTAA